MWSKEEQRKMDEDQDVMLKTLKFIKIESTKDKLLRILSKNLVVGIGKNANYAIKSPNWENFISELRILFNNL